MGGTNPWLVVETAGGEQFIDRSQIVRIAFRTEPARMRDHRGGEYPATTEEERANPDVPERLVAEIYTTDGGEPVRVIDHAAHQLHQQLQAQASATEE